MENSVFYRRDFGKKYTIKIKIEIKYFFSFKLKRIFIYNNGKEYFWWKQT